MMISNSLKGTKTTIAGVLMILGLAGAAIDNPHVLTKAETWTTFAAAIGLIFAADAKQEKS